MSDRKSNYYFTDNAVKVFALAGGKARETNSRNVGWKHLLFALMQNPDFTSYKILEGLGMPIGDIEKDIIFSEGDTEKNDDQEPIPNSLDVDLIKFRAQIRAYSLEHKELGTEDLLCALASTEWRRSGSLPEINNLFEKFGITLPKIEDVLKTLNVSTLEK